MSNNYNIQLQSNNTDLQVVLQTLQNKAAGNVEQATPEISINSSTGLVTATAGTKSSTYQLAFQSAKTITPTTTTQIAVSSGYYTGGNITVAGDANLISINIKSGVSIFGVNGTLAEGSSSTTNTYDTQLVAGTITSYTNDTLSAVRGYAFYQANTLQNINLAACTKIGAAAFSGCTALTTASFPRCEFIASSAFYGCSKLKNISFPACISIYYRGFTNCSSLATANFPSCTYVGGYAFQNCTKLATLSLPLCRTIYSSTFQSCKSLTTVSLPNITVIGSTAFGSCTNLNTFYLTGSTLCTLSNSNAFAGTGITSTGGSIYVNASLVDSYKAATNWTYFSNVIYAATE